MIEEYSGIVYSNTVAENASVSSGTVYQTFTLPVDYVRGAQSVNPSVPYLTGIQIYVLATKAAITLPWTIQHKDINGNWDIIGSGMATKAAITGQQYWISLFSDELIEISPSWVNDTFQFSLGIDGATISEVYYATPNPLAAQGLEGYVVANAVPNGRFAHDIVGQVPAGWTALSSATLSVTSTPSLQISTTGTGEGADATVPVTGEFFAGFTYTLSLLAKGQAGGEQVSFSFGSTGIDMASTNVNLTTAYVEYTVSWTPRANSSDIFINVESLGTGSLSFFVQNVMVGTSTTYVDGDTTGYTWSGPPGNSTTIQAQGSLLFNLLALTADSGFDILGNQYRSNVVPHIAGNMNTETTLEGTNASWTSRPNPSPQAIEAIYIDMSDQSGNPTVFDSILLDPITQGVDFNVYYGLSSVSNVDPGSDISAWDNLLWTHVPQEYTLTKRDTYAMPRPVTANYVKIEFTNLQGQNYNPKGNPSVIYNKFPSWVYYYFLLQILPPQLGEDHFIGSSESVVFDYLDFAYNYYTGGIIQSASMPAPVVQQVQYEINQINTNPPNVDATTIGKINGNLNPYQSQPVLSAPGDYLPAASASDLGTYSTATNYSTEEEYQSFAARPLTGSGNYVSSRLKDDLLQEVTLPQMYFWQQCRHAYKQVQASFTNNRAYYVGIRELALLRQDFNIPVDAPVYYETFGDSFNQVTG